ncbi:hypothetical protein PFISCL1PPCAC_10463 [Pristionchus fissidentatus]|uniref:LIM zinc-binding domain-containing protein n=1 Tax=Pristionchus fissidentatus TaxID=1538716 RepID=A0AAV5VIH0_9BILA|nr:hypothetical protein PFISCL1PPCAC_10463 [Pristionchus fissidentatus]
MKKSGGNLVRKEFASELQEKIVKKIEEEEKTAKGRSRIDEKRMDTISSRRKCTECGLPLGKGSAMVIGSIGLSFHIRCFVCSHCGNSLDSIDSDGAEVQLDGGRLKCLSCYVISSRL